MDEKELLRRFYNIWFRSPTKEEFEACGGNMERVNKKYGAYREMLKQYGYPKSHVLIETYEATHEDGRVFTGSKNEVVEEIECRLSMFDKAFKDGKDILGWTVRKILFDVEMFNNYKD